MRRTIGITGVVVLILASFAGVLVATRSSEDAVGTAADIDAEPRQMNTTVAARKDFVEDTEVGGTLGFGAVESLPNLATGVVTWLPEPGTVVGIGDTLYEINGRPVLLLEGDAPMYRTLDSRTTDGPDVLVLEQLLIDLGHATETNLKVDDDFTSTTADAVVRWEEARGLEPTGAVALGDIVYRTEGFRVSAVNATVGQQINGGSILSFTSTERQVTVLLDTALTGLLAEGDIVAVELPDETVVDGTVTFVSNVAVTEGQGPNATSYIEVEIVLAGKGSGFDESPVTVRVETILEQDATVVPIAALLALAEGGYAVEVVGDDGTVTLVAVQLGTFLDNEVAITGSVQPGMTVVIP